MGGGIRVIPEVLDHNREFKSSKTHTHTYIHRRRQADGGTAIDVFTNAVSTLTFAHLRDLTTECT